ncbi:adenylosuccinate lyase [Effusibacillus dendaii]|uniref:Adenylosuccinate lyase n=1 Tax=Effusibacillus dendaii TaxID=2743772 RepID=A0A7I8DAY6_9BACL|nr:adenylosuccinate lyase [Effusibacillus dendaii]BCJ87157.1 adenylosuccinate lyase [Effusibacillus dendaii]
MSIKAISPLDGRYQEQLGGIESYVSEWALMKYRVHVEVEWLIAMSKSEWIADVRPFTSQETEFLRKLAADFSEADALEVKQIESTTKHDVKAVEYFIKRRIKETSLADVAEFVHFCCTSEDINNLSYALMVQGAIKQVWLPLAEKLAGTVAGLAKQTQSIPMLARTHGQPASPTTVGKELAVFVRRWQRQLVQIDNLEFLGKFNGAVGNFNAHVSAYPDAPWEEIAGSFVESLGLAYNPLTTQIESHDYLAEAFMAICRFNNIGIDMDRDIWSYISLSYFKQIPVAGEVGSSTMPHKVNPINFENSEANFGMSNAVLEHLAMKLPISRMQRDLTDSSTLRNIGVGIGHSVLALQAALRGLKQLSVNEAELAKDLDHAWEVLAEAVQTVMRKNGHDNPYEKLKDLTRGAQIDQAAMRQFIESLDLPADDKSRLLAMTPASYIGIAPQLLRHIEK